MVRDIIEVYLQIAIGLEERGRTYSAYYALERAIQIESQRKHVL